MEYERKQAKELVRAFRAGESDARRRAEAVLGARARERFLLSDAQHVVAQERGFRTWSELKRARNVSSANNPEDDVVVATNLVYLPGTPVEIVVRRRDWRYDISDSGRAVELARRPSGWLDTAEEVVGAYALNVNRRGVVFVQCNESRLDSLVERVADCSVALYQELLERELGSA